MLATGSIVVAFSQHRRSDRWAQDSYSRGDDETEASSHSTSASPRSPMLGPTCSSRRCATSPSSGRPPRPRLSSRPLSAPRWTRTISTTLEGNVTNWNPAAEELLGYSREEIIGEHIARLVPDHSSIVLEELLDAVYPSLTAAPAIPNGSIVMVDEVDVAVSDLAAHGIKVETSMGSPRWFATSPSGRPRSAGRRRQPRSGWHSFPIRHSKSRSR